MKLISVFMSLLILLGPLPVFSLESAAKVQDKEYFIDAGDVLSINVFPAQEFSRDVTVQPDGNIEIPMLGSLKAQGMKPDELEKVLTAKYSRYVSNPSITINLRKFSFNRVALIGQVNAHGYYEYREGMRLLDLVALAGGLQDYARTSHARIFRKTTSEGGNVTEKVIKADLEGVFSGDMDKNITLTSGDIVYIPRKPYSAASRWVTDNITPWATLFIFAITAGIVARKN